MSNPWEFDEAPTPEQIAPLLATVPAWAGSDRTMADYQEYVVPIFSRQTGKWRLYTMVSGKMRIMRDAHDNADVYEEVNLEFKTNMLLISGTMQSIKFGKVFEASTARIGDDVKGADRTNPVENALTSWRGRACSALCCAGVLPYSGTASAEEMQEQTERSKLEERGVKVITPTALMDKPDVDTNEEKIDSDADTEPKSATPEVDKVIISMVEATKKKLEDNYEKIITKTANELGIDISNGIETLDRATVAKLVTAALKKG